MASCTKNFQKDRVILENLICVSLEDLIPFSACKLPQKHSKWSQSSTKWIPWSRKKTPPSKRPWVSKPKLKNLTRFVRMISPVFRLNSEDFKIFIFSFKCHFRGKIAKIITGMNLNISEFTLVINLYFSLKMTI